MSDYTVGRIDFAPDDPLDRVHRMLEESAKRKAAEKFISGQSTVSEFKAAIEKVYVPDEDVGQMDLGNSLRLDVECRDGLYTLTVFSGDYDSAEHKQHYVFQFRK